MTMVADQLDMFSTPVSGPANRLDEKCSTCAFRVFERTAPDTMSMNCLHANVGRLCEKERTDTSGRCGTGAILWTRRTRG